MSDSFVTPWTVASQASLSMGFPGKRVLEWVTIVFSRGSSPPKNPTRVSSIAWGFLHCKRILYHWASREAQWVYRYLILTVLSPPFPLWYLLVYYVTQLMWSLSITNWIKTIHILENKMMMKLFSNKWLRWLLYYAIIKESPCQDFWRI